MKTSTISPTQQALQPKKNMLKIDFVSDVSCPWCAIGLQSLQTALQRLEGQVEVDIHFQPFELNPDMGPELDFIHLMAME